MKKIFSSLFVLGFLAGCSANDDSGISLEYLLENPLFAERYADQMVDRVVELKIQKDALLEDEAKLKVVDDTRTKWMKIAQEATAAQREGTIGSVIGINEFARGEVLYLNDVLYFASDFETVPGPALSVYFTEVVDPRDVEFPDETAIKIGKLQTPYGNQRYSVPHQENPLLLRTVVLWDDDLGRLWGFAQISK